MARRDGKPGVIREFFTGVGFLRQGFRVWRTAPRVMLLGVIPAAIVAIAVVAGLVAVAMNIEAIAAWATPFATSWAEPFRSVFRIIAALAALVLALQLVVYTYTAVTLAIGGYFYERIWQHVEHSMGGPSLTAPDGWKAFRTGLGNSIKLLFPTAAVGILLLLCGFIPIIGQILVPALGALFGGWFLALELTGFAFDARGATLRERRAVLGRRRAVTVGFGASCWLLFLLPFGAIIAMPAAVAGATILSRRMQENAEPFAAAAATPETPIPR
ncbi:MAG: EI24 domain-containing protein [Microbacteriaceae bacterium]